MTRTIKTALSVLAAVAFLGLSSGCAAKELYLVREGKPIEKNMVQAKIDPASGWTQRKGKTADGMFRPDLGARNSWHFPANKSALGDCEFTATFQVHPNECRPRAYSGPRGPRILIIDRGAFGFYGRGGHVLLSSKKIALPLKEFAEKLSPSAHDGKTHTLSVKRVGDRLSFSMDGRKLNEQTIDPDVNLIFALTPIESRPRIASMKLTAEKFSDNLKTEYKRAAPIKLLYDGTGKLMKAPEYGKACRYRIPALAVSTKGTILAFAEARRVDGRDIGNIDAVVRRSEDNGKTWGPEVVVWDDGARSVNNPSAVVDPKTGRICVFMGRWDGTTPSQHVAHSDDDGKTWSKSQEMTQVLRGQIKDGRRLVIPGPGSGIALVRGKYAGRLIIPMNHGAAWGPSVVYSDDHGKTWKPGGALHANIGESKCAELADGSVLFVGNPGGGTRRRLTVITEGGTKNATKMWHAEDLTHVGCQGAVERHSWPKDGKPGIILYSGPGLERARAQGTLRGSYDEGKTWPWKLLYYQGGSGYSDLAVLPDGRVIVLFEKDGKSDLGFTILPAPPATPPAKAAK